MLDSAWKYWYRNRHNERCRASGDVFETYVTAALSRFHSDYLNPDPMGRRGDGGCDGLAEGATILYACYGQRATTKVDDKTKTKLASDFARGLSQWPSFNTWRFITNAPFGSKPTASLISLQQQHGADSDRPLTLEVWKAPDDLWWKVVSHLTFEQLNEIMPGCPHAQDVELSELIELIDALDNVGDDDASHLNAIRPVPFTKMDFNQLPQTTRSEFNEGRLLSRRLDAWFAEQADPGLRDAKARRVGMIYESARQVTNDVREIVRRVYGALGGPDFDMSTPRANAVYAATVYFFDSCDIFEEPPTDYDEGEVRDVTAD